jgi:hypothetical protein
MNARFLLDNNITNAGPGYKHLYVALQYFTTGRSYAGGAKDIDGGFLAATIFDYFICSYTSSLVVALPKSVCSLKELLHREESG